MLGKITLFIKITLYQLNKAFYYITSMATPYTQELKKSFKEVCNFLLFTQILSPWGGMGWEGVLKLTISCLLLYRYHIPNMVKTGPGNVWKDVTDHKWQTQVKDNRPPECLKWPKISTLFHLLFTYSFFFWKQRNFLNIIYHHHHHLHPTLQQSHPNLLHPHHRH